MQTILWKRKQWWRAWSWGSETCWITLELTRSYLCICWSYYILCIKALDLDSHEKMVSEAICRSGCRPVTSLLIEKILFCQNFGKVKKFTDLFRQIFSRHQKSDENAGMCKNWKLSVKSIGKVGSVKEFYFAYRTEYVKEKKIVPPIVYWLSSISRSWSVIGQQAVNLLRPSYEESIIDERVEMWRDGKKNKEA